MPTYCPSEKPTYNGEITKLSHDGRGIATINGKVTFIRGGLPGEQVTFFYTKKHAKYDEGEVVKVLTASPDRVEPICTHFGVCGGCSLQHISPSQQITLKQSVLLEQLAFIGATKPKVVLSPLTASTQGYRHKARLGVKYVRAKNKVLVGFRETNGRYVADISQCPILHESVGKKLHAIGQLVQTLEAYQTIPQIEVAVDDNDTALIFRHLEPLSQTDAEKLIDFARTENFHIYLQPGGPKTVHLLYPQKENFLLHYALPRQNIELYFHPSQFTQVNFQINRQMVAQAIELLDPQPHETVLDLFCGLGNFTLPLAKLCKEIIGIEGEAELVEHAKYNAMHNHIPHAQFYCADLSKNISQYAFAQRTFDKILLDPPRTGAGEIVSNIAQFKASMILYVSCNPATLARDAKILSQQGYQLLKTGVMDMFTHTDHVEAMALFKFTASTGL